MQDYKHHGSGFFVKREEAQIALTKLAERGLPVERLKIYDNDAAAPSPPPNANSNESLKNMIVDGAIGTAVGTGVGALAELALVAASVTLFVASPLVAPLAMLGWGASVGGLIGAVMGAEATEKKEGKLADLIQDAIMSGQVVLVAQTLTEQETAMARDIIKASVGDYKDILAV